MNGLFESIWKERCTKDVKSLETAQFMVNNVNKDQSWEWQVKGNENEYCII